MLGINTNIGSLYSQSTLNVGLRRTESAVQRLSSGLRVNSARDDAAGLGISTRLSAISRGLDAALSGVSMGTSMMQVADGALSSVSDNLQRMRELALQASTGILSDSDREALDQEYQALASENKRIIENTEFNRQKVFGSANLNTNIQVGGQAGQTADFGLQAFFQNNGTTVSGSILSAFQAQTITLAQGPQVVNNDNGGTSANFVSGADGTYNVNVSRGVGFNYDDNLGAANPTTGVAGSAAVPASTNYSNGNAVINGATGAANSYRVTVNTLAQNQVTTVNVGAGNPTFGSNDTSALPGAQPTRNDFEIDFGNGDTINFSVGAGGEGTYTASDYVTAFNTAAGGRVTASYNPATGAFTYTGINGTDNSFSVNNDTTNFLNVQQATGDAFQVAQNQGQAAQNFTGTVDSGINGGAVAFNTVNGNGVTADGLTFDVTGLGTEDVTIVNAVAAVPASTNTFNVAFGDGSNFSLNLGSGTFNTDDFITAFNAQQSRFTATRVGNTIEYRNNETGSLSNLTITNTSVNDGGSNNIYNLGAGQQVQAGTDTTATVNGGAANVITSGTQFTDAGTGATFEITGLADGLTTFTATTPPPTTSTFGNLENEDNARATVATIDAYLDSVNSLRGTVGANISRLESIGFSIRQDFESYSMANGRIVDADFARETARLAREQLLQQAGIGILTQANQRPEIALRLLG